MPDKGALILVRLKNKAKRTRLNRRVLLAGFRFLVLALNSAQMLLQEREQHLGGLVADPVEGPGADAA